MQFPQRLKNEREVHGRSIQVLTTRFQTQQIRGNVSRNAAAAATALEEIDENARDVTHARFLQFECAQHVIVIRCRSVSEVETAGALGEITPDVEGWVRR